MYSAVSVINLTDTEEWFQEVQNDPKWQRVVHALIGDPNSHPGFQFQAGRLLYKGRLVLSKGSNKIPIVLVECHDSISGGHSGFFRTYKRVSSFFYWEGMRNAVKQYVEACEVCQRQKYSTLAPGGLLQPLPIPTQVWQDISMDFISGLPKSKGKDTIFVVVDRLTKYAHFYPLGHPFTAKDVAALFVKEVVKLHGFPATIVSDRDRIFLSHFGRNYSDWQAQD